MPSLPPNPSMSEPIKDDPVLTMHRWNQFFGRIWSSLVFVVNALCKVDTLANRLATPPLNEIIFVASDTYQMYVGINGVWAAVGRVGGTVTGAIPFVEISDADAPAANGARLYARDNGAGKTQLVVRFNTGAIQVIATEP